MISESSVYGINLLYLALTDTATPRTIDLLPYDGRQVAVVEGPAGEWLELID